MGENVDEDLIEATIRRVAEAQAARAAAPEAPDPAVAEARDADDADGVEPAVAFDAPARVPDEEVSPADAEFEAAEPTLHDVDESAIEQTIRRVAAARAERDSVATATIAPAPPEQPLTFVPRGAQLATAAVHDAPRIEDDWGEAILRIERTVDEMHAMLRALVDRAPSPALPPHAQPSRQTDEDWEDDAPPVQRTSFAPPARPSVFRDVAPAPASPPPAMQHADVDTRPLSEPPPPVRPDSRRGLDLLPRTYRITVEDKRRGVDLVPLHRALLAMDGVRDMSLLSYNNGVAIVALETVNDLDPQALSRAVSRAMSREATVETHNERTLVVKLAED